MMKLDDYTKMKENRDYEMVPTTEGDDQSWLIRIISGEFIETVIAFGTIKIDGTAEDPLMTFDYTVVSSPENDLTSENEGLQQVAGDVLLSLLVKGIDDGTVAFHDEPTS